MSVRKNQTSILENLDLERQVNESQSKADEAVDWEAFKKVVINDPTNKKIKQIANKYGYEADQSYIRSWGEPTIQIRSKNYNDMHPDIYYRSDHFGKKVSQFEIQTTSYGSMTTKEYETFIKCCNDAYNMVKELEKLDLTKLPKEPKED